MLELCLQNVEKKNVVWIHCSAGIGRTGTLGSVIEAVRLYGKYKKISIFAIVENLRMYRYYAVQTLEQYQFLYNYLAKKLQ
jgi:protein tyrosine phosphatase